jgi:cation diffusion facilitator CzcD-associated flavoprotein CzcO
MRLPVLVVGAGPAGLATSRELTVRRVEHLVFERGGSVAYPWTRLYDSLRLHTGRHLSALPGLAFPSGTSLYPTRAEFIGYLERYTAHFQLPVETGRDVVAAAATGRGWRVSTASGELEVGALVVATGILSNPHMPAFDGLDRFGGGVRHSVDYRRPAPYVGKRTLVVGVGNSGGEIAAELASAGSVVTVSVRSGAEVLPRDVMGVPVQYLAAAVAKLPFLLRAALARAAFVAGRAGRSPSVLPRPTGPSACPSPPLIGFHLVDAVRQGRVRLRPGVETFTPRGVRFADGSEDEFDEVIVAAGYRAALAPFAGIRLDQCGFGCRHSRVVSADQANLFFVGHNNDTRGGLCNIAQDARLAADAIVRLTRSA